MKEAHSQLALKPMQKEESISIAKNGQWELDKSGYKGYTPEDNARRKANNVGETDIKSMPSIKQYGGSGPDAASREAAQMKARSKKNPVKVYTPEEIKALNEKQS